MRSLTRIICALLLLTAGVARGQQQYPAITPFDFTDVGGRVTAGSFLWNNDTLTQGLTVPRPAPGQPARRTVSMANLWLGGLNAQGAVRVAAETERMGTPPAIDFWPGAIYSTGPMANDSVVWAAHVWHLTRADVAAHRAGVGQPGYQPLPDVLTWPATTRARPWRQAAPFVDLGSDGFYDPLLGDYPDLPGDDNLLSVYSDAYAKLATQSPIIGVQVTQLVYGYAPGACGHALDQTVFVRYFISNRGSETLHDAYVGHWADFDIGGWGDDYMACDTARAMMYGYNRDAFDEDTLERWFDNSTIKGYGAHPPAQAVVALDQRPVGGMSYEGVFSWQGYPHHQQYYELLRSRWLNGRPLTYGGSGYDSTAAPARFIFSGDPVTGTGWLETPATWQWGQAHGLLNFRLGPGGVFAPGATHTLTLAYVFGQDTTATVNPHLASVVALRQAVDEVRACYLTRLLGTAAPTDLLPALTLHPNPAHHVAHLNGAPTGVPVALLDLTGRVVRRYPAGAATLDLRGLPAGLYVVRVGAVSRRLVVE